MIEDLQLKGYSDSNQPLYITAVHQLCEHFDKADGTASPALSRACGKLLQLHP